MAGGASGASPGTPPPMTLPNGTAAPPGYGQSQDPALQRLDRQYAIADLWNKIDPAAGAKMLTEAMAQDPRVQGTIAGARKTAELPAVQAEQVSQGNVTKDVNQARIDAEAKTTPVDDYVMGNDGVMHKVVVSRAQFAATHGAAAQPTPAVGGPPSVPQNPYPGVVGPQELTPQQTALTDIQMKEFAKTKDDRTDAISMKKDLATFSQNMDAFRTGKTGAERLAARSGIVDAAQALGFTADPDLTRSVQAGEVMNKTGTKIGWDLVNKSARGREPGFIMQQGVGVAPGVKLSELGNQALVGLMGADADRRIDLQNEKENWLASGKPLVQFDNWFNTTHPPEMYVSRVLPYTVQSPADAVKLPYGATFKTPQMPGRLFTNIPAQQSP